MPRFSTKFLTWAACFSVLIAGPLLRALDLPASFTMDLPFQANQATPVWLGHPEVPPTTFATLNLPIIPPDANASLLVTVFFQEKEGGFLRITWQGAGGAQLLSDNFYEGIAMNNQRSLLITPDTMAGEGTLSFQCGDAALGIRRIKLEWLENRNGLVSPEVQDLLVTPGTGPTQPAQSLNGAPKPADEGAWRDQLVTVPITDQPQRIEQGVEFSVQLDAAPGSGRLALKEAGLPWGQRMVVWVNRQRAGTITPAVPDLIDDGYVADTNPPDTYVGWRDGSFHVPASLLKAGVNTIQFSVEDEVPSTPANTADAAPAPLPLAVKDVVFQLRYSAPAQNPPPVQDAESSTPDQTASAPTGPIPPTPVPSPSSSTSSETNTP